MSARSLRTRAAITFGRAAGWLSRVTGRGQGATISGRVINAVAPDALHELGTGLRVALVSATNGKTTTTRLLAAALETEAAPVATNATGANLTSGIAPVLARAATPGVAVLEVDERVLPRVVDPLDAELLVLGNLSRDQLDRYGEVHAVGDTWRAVTDAHPDLRVVANASDPHVVWAAAAGEDDVGRARARVAQRRGHVPQLRRTAPLDRGPLRLPRLRVRATGDAQPARGRRARSSTAAASRCGCSCPAGGTSPTPRSRSRRRRRTSASTPIGQRPRPPPSRPSPAAT